MPTQTADFTPDILGTQLATRTGNYQARRAVEPIMVHDFNASLGDTVQIDRYPTYGERGMSKLQRQRNPEQIIGTGASENVSKTSRQVTLQEFTGPSTPGGQPACLHLTKKDMRYARQKLWQIVNGITGEEGIRQFHESIGSMILADDYARFDDRAIVEELSRCAFKYNPQAKPDAQVLNTDKCSTADLRIIEETLNTLNTPPYPDGFYRCLCSLRYLRHMREDPLFQQYAIAQIQSGIPQMAAMSTILNGQGGGGGLATGMGPMMDFSIMAPIQYEHFVFYPTNTLPTRVINSNNGPQTAFLAYFFGPGSVGQADGDQAPMVQEYGLTDYNRHWFYIWCMYRQYEYLLDDNEFSGAAIEARTFAI